MTECLGDAKLVKSVPGVGKGDMQVATSRERLIMPRIPYVRQGTCSPTHRVLLITTNCTPSNPHTAQESKIQPANSVLHQLTMLPLTPRFTVKKELEAQQLAAHRVAEATLPCPNPCELESTSHDCTSLHGKRQRHRS